METNGNGGNYLEQLNKLFKFTFYLVLLTGPMSFGYEFEGKRFAYLG